MYSQCFESHTTRGALDGCGATGTADVAGTDWIAVVVQFPPSLATLHGVAAGAASTPRVWEFGAGAAAAAAAGFWGFGESAGTDAVAGFRGLGAGAGAGEKFAREMFAGGGGSVDKM